jgi:hypothetical protein
MVNFAVLSSNRFSHRWRACNKLTEEFASTKEEDQWRAQHLHLLSEAHTLGGITAFTIELVDSKYSVRKLVTFLSSQLKFSLQDAAFELECETFKWRWETFRIPPKYSAELISKHLLIPLISLNHVAFASMDTVSELSQTNLENVIILCSAPFSCDFS